MKLLQMAAALVAAGMLAACDQTTTTTAPTTAPPTDIAVGGECYATNAREWAANVDSQPIIGQPPGRRLLVHGKVDFPRLGHTWTLTRNPADDPASGEVRLTLTTTAPADLSGTQVETVEPRYEAPATAAQYTQVTVFCGRGAIATITDIPETQ